MSDHPFGGAAYKHIGDDAAAVGARDDQSTMLFLRSLYNGFGGGAGFD